VLRFLLDFTNKQAEQALPMMKGKGKISGA
jgi:hypothetical protein